MHNSPSLTLIARLLNLTNKRFKKKIHCMAESKEKMATAAVWDRIDSSTVIWECKGYLEPKMYYILIAGLLFSQFAYSLSEGEIFTSYHPSFNSPDAINRELVKLQYIHFLIRSGRLRNLHQMLSQHPVSSCLGEIIFSFL